MYAFLNSQLFIALVTLFVGFSAIILYVKQKKDYKRQAASLILQEMRYAEQLIRNSSDDSRYKLADKLLPTNSWNDNVHLFLHDLEETEIDLISRFYSKTAYLDVLITKISDFKNQPKQPQIIIAPSQNQQMPIMQPQQQITLPIAVDPMQSTQIIIREISQSIEFVYNTPAGEKLKMLSRKKFLLFF
jgi:hypothetical protein